MKRGQISLYILLGVIVLLVFAIGLKASTLKPAIELQEDKSLFAQECLDYSGKKALEEIGLKGGDLYIGLPKLSLADSKKVTYLYEEGFAYLPQNEALEQQINSRTSIIFKDCISKSNDVIYSDSNNVLSTITEDSILFETRKPVIVAGKEELLEAEVSVKLGKIRDAAQAVLDSIGKSDISTNTKITNFIQPHLNVKPEFNMQFAYSEISLPEGISAKYEIYEPATTLWVVEDNDYKFVFAAKHMRKSI